MATHDALTFTALRQANAARQAEWCPDQVPDLSFRGNEMAGEVGEACNVIKKLERERQGWRGSRATVADLVKELADVVICADLVAMQIGADLGAAVAAKFDEASDKNGLATRISAGRQTTKSADEDVRKPVVCVLSVKVETEDLTRPIVGIENRTAQEVFDIMSYRILSTLSASREGG